MTTINLTADTFESQVTSDGITLVDFWAGWCGPCMKFAPVFEQVSDRHPDATFAKVDTEAEQGLAAALQITSIPTLMAFRDGILVYAQPGALPAESLEEIVSKVKELDMDDVRAQVAAENAAYEKNTAEGNAEA